MSSSTAPPRRTILCTHITVLAFFGVPKEGKSAINRQEASFNETTGKAMPCKKAQKPAAARTC